MAKILNIVIVLLILFAIETGVSLIFFALYKTIEFSRLDIYDLNASIKSAIFLTWARLVFYFIIQIALFYWLNNKLQMDNKMMKLILLNCGLYILISLLYGFILRPETKELFTNPLFYILIISTALSPIILNLIPYFKRFINTI